MKTPNESWEEYRNFVYESLPEDEENNRKRDFFAGAESVFKLLELYRAANTKASVETIPPEDRLIDEIERKSALGEIE